MSGTILSICGPVVTADGLADATSSDLVRIGDNGLLGEVVSMTETYATIQMYDGTDGLAGGTPVDCLGVPRSVELGPGLLSHLYDGLQRPLSGRCRGPALDRTQYWTFTPAVRVGDLLRSGDIIGTVRETERVCHRIPVPDGLEGTVVSVEAGSFRVADTIAVLEDTQGVQHELTMLRKRPVHGVQTNREQRLPTRLLRWGVEKMDMLFPMVKGGTAGLVCGSETGKTVLLRQLAGSMDADVLIYIGCGMRGDAVAALLHNGSQTGVMEKTVFIAAAADQPVTARVAAVDTGMTVAEYFRDMGCDAAVIIDDLSRWADALRVLSGCLGEQPAGAGYPAYLASRLAQCCARAGEVDCPGGESCRGSVTLIASALPTNGAEVDPVIQTVKCTVDVFRDVGENECAVQHRLQEEGDPL